MNLRLNKRVAEALGPSAEDDQKALRQLVDAAEEFLLQHQRTAHLTAYNSFGTGRAGLAIEAVSDYVESVAYSVTQRAQEAQQRAAKEPTP